MSDVDTEKIVQILAAQIGQLSVDRAVLAARVEALTAEISRLTSPSAENSQVAEKG